MEQILKQFELLIKDQLRRLETLDKPKKDFSAVESVTVGIVPGDGIGAVIVPQAVRVLNRLLEDEMADGRVVLRHIDGLTIENRLARNQSVPSEVLAEIKTCDVLLKGPTTTPNGGSMESANVTLRRELDLYANVRPVVVPEEGIDWIFYRENTEGE